MLKRNQVHGGFVDDVIASEEVSIGSEDSDLDEHVAPGAYRTQVARPALRLWRLKGGSAAPIGDRFGHAA